MERSHSGLQRQRCGQALVAKEGQQHQSGKVADPVDEHDRSEVWLRHLGRVVDKKQVKKFCRQIEGVEPWVMLEMLEKVVEQEGWTSRRTTFATIQFGEALARGRHLITAQKLERPVGCARDAGQGRGSSAVLKQAPFDESKWTVEVRDIRSKGPDSSPAGWSHVEG